MTQAELTQLVTIDDLRLAERRLFKISQDIQQQISLLVTLSNDGKKKPQERQFYSPKELAGLLGLSQMTINRWLQEGKIKGLQEGGYGCSWIIPVSELHRLTETAESIEPTIDKGL